jgi:hypothetical protein
MQLLERLDEDLQVSVLGTVRAEAAQCLQVLPGTLHRAYLLAAFPTISQHHTLQVSRNRSLLAPPPPAPMQNLLGAAAGLSGLKTLAISHRGDLAVTLEVVAAFSRTLPALPALTGLSLEWSFLTADIVAAVAAALPALQGLRSLQLSRSHWMTSEETSLPRSCTAPASRGCASGPSTSTSDPRTRPQMPLRHLCAPSRASPPSRCTSAVLCRCPRPCSLHSCFSCSCALSPCTPVSHASMLHMHCPHPCMLCMHLPRIHLVSRPISPWKCRRSCAS